MRRRAVGCNYEWFLGGAGGGLRGGAQVPFDVTSLHLYFYPLGPRVCFLWRVGFSGAFCSPGKPGPEAARTAVSTVARVSPRAQGRLLAKPGHTPFSAPGHSFLLVSAFLCSLSPRASTAKAGEPPAGRGGKEPGSRGVASIRYVDATVPRTLYHLARETGL